MWNQLEKATHSTHYVLGIENIALKQTFGSQYIGMQTLGDRLGSHGT